MKIGYVKQPLIISGPAGATAYNGTQTPIHPSRSSHFAFNMKFQGSKNYVATQDLMLAVNASATLKKPLLDRKSVV